MLNTPSVTEARNYSGDLTLNHLTSEDNIEKNSNFSRRVISNYVGIFFLGSIIHGGDRG